MANTTETATFNVKSNVGEVGKDAASAAGEFRVMGVSLNSVTRSFKSMGAAAKASFATIKAGLISTGVAAFAVVIGSLATFFANTKRGADKLSQAFTAMGAVVDVLKDRISKVGEGLSFFFSGEFRKAGEALKGTFSNITAEVVAEVAAMTMLKKRTQELRDADNEFMIQKAATRQEIERARLIAEDETKSAKERLDNLRKALDLEEKTTQRELELARERMKIQQEEMALSENSAEDEAELARLKTAVIETETASIKMRRRVVTEVNALEREIQAEKKAGIKELQDIRDAEFDAMVKANEEWNKEQEIKYNEEVRLAKMAADQKIAIENAVLQNKLRVTSAIGGAIGALGGLMEKGSSEAKAAALAQIAINTGVGFVQGLDIAQKSAAGTGPAAVYAFPAFYATQVAAILGAVSSARSALGGGGGGVSAPSSNTPAPQMMSGAFDMSGGQAPEVMRAYVLTDEMTNSQDQLANIRRRSTI